MEKWMRLVVIQSEDWTSACEWFCLSRYIFKHGDLDGDGQLDFAEAEHLAKMNKERANTSKEEEELWESLERDDEEDEEYDEADYE